MDKLNQLLEDIRVNSGLAEPLDETMYAIGSGGLRRLGGMTVFPNQVYYMGASSSPDGIFVTRVTDDTVTYKQLYSMGKEQRIQRPIADDLIRQGTETWLKSGYSKYHPERARKFKALLAGKKQPPEKEEDYVRWEVDAVATNPPTGKMTRETDPWYRAEEYGNVGSSEDPKHGTVYNITSVTGLELKRLRKDKAFKVLSATREKR